MGRGGWFDSKWLRAPGLAVSQTVTLKTSWQPEHSTFIIWDPIQKGWDKEAGLKIDMIYFDSGMAQMEALAAKQWVAGATGSVPCLWAPCGSGPT